MLRGIRQSRNFGTLHPLDHKTYAAWLNRFHTSTPPLILTHPSPSFVFVIQLTSCQNTLLKENINSIEKQTYPHWNAIVFCRNQQQSASVRAMISHSHKERWIIVDLDQENVPGKAACAMIRDADWVTLTLGQSAYYETTLAEIALYSSENKELRIIYTDEDDILNFRRENPYFKPDWNPDLLRSFNYIGETAFYQSSLIESLPEFPQLLATQSPYELTLKASSICHPNEIGHIARILCHNIKDNPTDSLPPRTPAQALENFYNASNIDARIESTDFGLRTHYPIKSPLPLISILIPTRNQLSLLRRCVESIELRTDYTNYEIVIVDNGSDDPATIAYLGKLSHKDNFSVAINNSPFNYSALMNFAVNYAKGEILCMLNNDTEVITSNWLTEMASHALRDEVGVVGAKLLYPDNTVQHAGVILGVGGCAGHAHRGFSHDAGGYFCSAQLTRNFSAVTGACYMVRKSTFNRLGGFDEENLAISYNDIDFCLKAKAAGLRTVWTPYAILYHHESASRTKDADSSQQIRAQREEAYFTAKWENFIGMDPAYNPNLTLEHENFSLSYPPRTRLGES